MVRMAPKLTFGTAIADWQERINVARMREERAARARKIMRQNGIPVLLVASGENVRYLTGLRGSGSGEGGKYVLFFAEHDPVMFEQAGWFHQMPDQAPWIKHWRMAHTWAGGAPGPEAVKDEAAIFASGIHQELKDRGLAGEKLGMIGIDGGGRVALEKLGLHCTESKSLILEAREIKTADEINCLKMVAAIVEAAWYKVWQNLRPGLTEKDLAQIVGNTVYEAGADDMSSGSFRTGPASFERGFTQSGRMIQTGDLVYGALCSSIRYMGYGDCQYRTFITGRNPNAREKDWYKTLLERINNIIDAIKPGATTADAAKYFPPATKWGFKEEAEVLSIEIGHGIGLGGGYERPIINRQWSFAHPQVIEAGMVIAVESCEGEHRVGGVRLEDMVVVTETGCELIDHFPREEILVAPAA
ncbi:MAG: aminopeptidase P family protein [Chloroflexi bacterium]|nr:aminopeptidase P family protein [Chloroflexota bacterium]